MNTQSLYGELAIDLLFEHDERSLPQTNVTCHGCTSDRADRNDQSLPFALFATNAGGNQHTPKPFARSSEGCRKTEQDRQQNTCEKSRTDLAADSQFTGISKDLFQPQQPTIFGCSRAGFLALSEQESSVTDDKSVHPKIFEMQSRQGIPFFCRSRLEGECTSRYFWFFIRLMKLIKLIKLIVNNTIIQFNYSGQA